MSAPSGYSETSLAQFMHDELGPTARMLGYPEPADNPGVYAEAVNEAALSLGVNEISQASDIRKVRALAKREAWTMAVKALATKFDFSADGASYDRSQVFLQAKQALETAIADCLRLGLDGYSVSIRTLDQQYDPYHYPREIP